MQSTRDGVQLGMAVVDANGQPIGQVQEVRRSEFAVDYVRTGERYYVPYSAVRSLADDRVRLHIMAERLDRMAWERPPIENRGFEVDYKD